MTNTIVLSVDQVLIVTGLDLLNQRPVRDQLMDEPFRSHLVDELERSLVSRQRFRLYMRALDNILGTRKRSGWKSDPYTRSTRDFNCRGGNDYPQFGHQGRFSSYCSIGTRFMNATFACLNSYFEDVVNPIWFNSTLKIADFSDIPAVMGSAEYLVDLLDFTA